MVLLAVDVPVVDGIVGTVISAVLAVYLLYEKIATRWQKRKVQRDRDAAAKVVNDAAADAKVVVVDAAKLKNEETELHIGELARKAVSDAYAEATEVRKKIHEADVRAIRREIAYAESRLAALEERERECQKSMAELKQQNAEQEAEIAALRTEIARLKSELRACGTLPGAAPPEPLG